MKSELLFIMIGFDGRKEDPDWSGEFIEGESMGSRLIYFESKPNKNKGK